MLHSLCFWLFPFPLAGSPNANWDPLLTWYLHAQYFISLPKRAIFQTFWRLYCCTKSLFFEIETSNFGSSYVFASPLKWRGRILPNLTFWTPKWLFQVKSRYHYSKISVSWDKCMKLWLLAYFLILLNCAKFQKDWTAFILDILQGSPFDVFCFCNLPKIQRGGPL